MTSSDEAGQVVFTRMQQSTGSFGLRVKNWYIKQTSLGSSFILGTHGPQTNPQYGGILGSVVISGINFLGTSIGSPSIIQSGGTF